MNKQTMGIHHITAIVGHPQENVDFYAGVLGLRLVKKTVNFDDPETYHLYFGNEGGKPGTIITFFPWPNAYKGKNGGGQVGITSYVVPVGALSFWENRLEKFKISFTKTERFGEQYLSFDDPHGLHLELVARESGARPRNKSRRRSRGTPLTAGTRALCAAPVAASEMNRSEKNRLTWRPNPSNCARCAIGGPADVLLQVAADSPDDETIVGGLFMAVAPIAGNLFTSRHRDEMLFRRFEDDHVQLSRRHPPHRG